MKRKISGLLLAVLIISILGGCGRIGNLYFSTSLSDTYIAAGHKANLTTKEANLIFMDYQNRYNAYYSQTGIEDFWSSSVEGYSFAEYLKEKRIKEEISLLLLLNDMAIDEGVLLTKEEIAGCENAAAEYYSGLSEIELVYCMANWGDVCTLYQKYRTAQKMLETLTDGAYLEISDNDKRVIAVQIIRMNDADEAENVRKETINGADFLQAAKTYSTLAKIEYQVSRGTLNPVLEEVAFYLADDEISEVIQSGGSYFIIKCINDFDEALSIANEDNVYRQSLYDQWSPVVSEYADGHEIAFNRKIWTSMKFYETDAMKSVGLYDIYQKHFD